MSDILTNAWMVFPNILGELRPICSHQDGRYAIAGVLAERVDDRACLAATNGRALVVVEWDSPGEPGARIIGRQAIELMAGMPGTCALVGDDLLHIGQGHMLTVSDAVVEGQFPPWRDAMPTPARETTRMASLDPGMMGKALCCIESVRTRINMSLKMQWALLRMPSRGKKYPMLLRSVCHSEAGVVYQIRCATMPMSTYKSDLRSLGAEAWEMEEAI